MVSTEQEETKKLSPEELSKYVDDLNKKSKPPSQTSYSIGELARLHDIEELVIKPSYQRLFRWSEEDESAFIESILLNFPIPPIFVSMDSDGIFEVIDGLQRLSTIFHFLGQLPDRPEPLRLQGLQVLEKLNGLSFADLPKVLQRDISRSTLQLNVLPRLDQARSHEVFIRLNRNGRTLTAQEVRNAILDNLNLLDKLRAFKNHSHLGSIFILSKNEEQEAYDDELIVRYLFCRFCKKNPEQQAQLLKKGFSLESIFDTFALKFLSSIDLDSELVLFSKTLNLLTSPNEDTQFLSDYDKSRNRPKKNVRSLPMFMIVLTAVSLCLESNQHVTPSDVQMAVQRYWEKEGNSMQGSKAYRIIQKSLNSVDTFMEDLTSGNVS